MTRTTQHYGDPCDIPGHPACKKRNNVQRTNLTDAANEAEKAALRAEIARLKARGAEADDKREFERLAAEFEKKYGIRVV
ncbi:MAG: hypothetical protein WC277_03925 [Bacilli bacterium]